MAEMRILHGLNRQKTIMGRAFVPAAVLLSERAAFYPFLFTGEHEIIRYPL